MIKALLFDLDGVLVSTKRIHFDAFNTAIREIAGPSYELTYADHLRDYDGLSTNRKLAKLMRERELPPSFCTAIWSRKQVLTEELYSRIEVGSGLGILFAALREQYKVGVVTNSIRSTTIQILRRLGIDDKIDILVTNQDVTHPKPRAEVYLRAMIDLGCDPKECLIFEDSPVGLEAAAASGAHFCVVKDPHDITYDNIMKRISACEGGAARAIWKDDELTVLIPMAGLGSRFEKAGYSFPKPLIDVGGKTMIQCVVESLGIQAKYVYLVQRTHNDKYNLRALLNLITPNCTVIDVDGLTEGSACTTLLARGHIDTDKPLLIANSDQIVDWNSTEFLYKMNNRGVAGGILTFPSSHIKWSYAEVDENGYVKRVAEKMPISPYATVGIYWFRSGGEYIRYAENMIGKDLRVNGEFYICPVFNEYIQDGQQILIHEIGADQMHGTGTPEDLQTYLQFLHDRRR